MKGGHSQKRGGSVKIWGTQSELEGHGQIEEASLKLGITDRDIGCFQKWKGAEKCRIS